jgi:F0F1-type ATP synthase assembly protein I
MEGAGAGLGIFIQYMGQALPVLLIILAMVGIIVAVGYGIAWVIKSSMKNVHIR